MKVAIVLSIITLAALGLAGCGNSSQTGNPANAGPANSARAADRNPSAGNSSAIQMQQAPNNGTTQTAQAITPGEIDFKPAPENSEVGATQRPDGSIIEVRRFRNNPTFTEVEAVWGKNNERSLTFKLRNGQVITKQVENLPNMEVISTQVLKELAGIK